MNKAIELSEEDMIRNKRFNTKEEAMNYGVENLGNRPFLYGKENSTGKWKLFLMAEGTRIELVPIDENNKNGK